LSFIESIIQGVIERAGVAPILAVPLLADTSPNDQLLFFIEDQIRNNRISKNSTIYPNIEHRASIGFQQSFFRQQHNAATILQQSSLHPPKHNHPHLDILPDRNNSI
jgi:hypothetical protein